MLDVLLSPGALTTRFHPIVRERDGAMSVFAFECLTRGPAGTNFEQADVLFEYGRRKSAEVALDRACVSQAVATATAIGKHDLALNVHASTLSRDSGFARDLAQLAKSYGFTPEQIIVEIVEHLPVLNRRDFAASLASLRALGFRIALDDVGLGYSNFQMMIEAAPDYLKIDRAFIHGADHVNSRAAVIESILAFANRVGAHVVAEGVEDAADRTYLMSLGIELLQGYHYAHPLTAEQAGTFRPMISAA
ncbi:MAG TPA: EAL domain-containing protein [Thermoanaerobaculia bacterium]|jgi:EAL domain-containing protein (putative c-di-GMP-specific phosphodiesterase class I)